MEEAPKRRPSGRPFVKGKPGGRPFPKGVSGNPGGRARGQKVSTLISRQLELVAEDGLGGTNAEAMVRALMRLALGGDMAAIKEILDRTEGKSVARTEDGAAGTWTGLEDVPTEELLRLVGKDES